MLIVQWRCASTAGSGESLGSPFFGYFLWRSKESDCPPRYQRLVANGHPIPPTPHPSPLPQGERGPAVRRFSGLLERYLCEAPQLPTVQMICPCRAHEFHCPDADQQMLVHAFAIEVIGHAW